MVQLHNKIERIGQIWSPKNFNKRAAKKGGTEIRALVEKSEHKVEHDDGDNDEEEAGTTVYLPFGWLKVWVLLDAYGKLWDCNT